MSDVEWVEPYMAVVRLEKLWGIPRSFVEEIVRNVIDGGRVEVRAVPQYQYIPQIVTGRVRMVSNTLYAWGYQQLELNWKDLVTDGRKLIPSYLSVVNPTSIFKKAPEAEIKEAIRAVYDLARSNKQKPPNIKEIIEPSKTPCAARVSTPAVSTFKNWLGRKNLRNSAEGRARRSRANATRNAPSVLGHFPLLSSFFQGHLATFLFSRSYLRVRW